MASLKCIASQAKHNLIVIIASCLDVCCVLTVHNILHSYYQPIIFVSSKIFISKCHDHVILYSKKLARFSSPVQPGAGAHPASYTMDTGSFKGVKWLERVVQHPHLAHRLKKEYSYNPTSLLGLHGLF